jgi:hypothetical protein
MAWVPAQPPNACHSEPNLAQNPRISSLSLAPTDPSCLSPIHRDTVSYNNSRSRHPSSRIVDGKSRRGSHALRQDNPHHTSPGSSGPDSRSARKKPVSERFESVRIPIHCPNPQGLLPRNHRRRHRHRLQRQPRPRPHPRRLHRQGRQQAPTHPQLQRVRCSVHPTSS